MFSERTVPPIEAPRKFFRKETFFIPGQLFPEIADRTLNQIEILLQNPDRFIDKGGAGAVYRLGGDICIKRMEARRLSPRAHLFDLGNPVSLEAQFLLEASRIDVEGVRTCRCYGFYSSQIIDIPDLLLMEELDAVGLQHVLNGTVSSPESFDPTAFFDDYCTFIDVLHEIGVAHGDIAPRNVMIDRKTGKPRVIDFGRSSRLVGAARDKLIDKDIDDLNKVYEEMEKYLHFA